jgi:dCTP deaminase
VAKLTGSEIVKQREAGKIVIDPFDPKNVGPNSVDLTLSPEIAWYVPREDEFKSGDPHVNPVTEIHLDMQREPAVYRHNMSEGSGYLDLQPGRLYLGATNERAGSDHYVPCIEGRSSIARLGLMVHLTAGFGDLGFKGCWTLEMTALHPIRVYAGVRICQVFFDTIEGVVGQTYDKEHRGKYGEQLETRPIPSRLFMDFR